MSEAQPTVNISFTRANGSSVSISGPISDTVLEEIAINLSTILTQTVTEPPAPTP